MQKSRLIKTLVFALAMVLTITAIPILNWSTASSSGGVIFKSASTLQTVKMDENLSSFEDLQTLTVSAAKGETDATQFIVNSAKEITNYDLVATDLTCGQSTISAENIDVYVQIYTHATDNVLFVGTYGGGYYPDCLIPISYIKNAKENNVKAGLNQGFWIDINVPETAQAGVYQGQLTFTFNGTEKQIPLSVEVYDFTMPEAPGIATCYLIWNDWLLDIEFDNTTEKHWDYYDTLLKYNVSGYVFPSKNPEEFATALKEYYTKVNMFGIPYRAISKTVNDWDYYVSYMLAVGELCKKDGINYFDKAYYYFDMFYDEATSFDWRIEQMKEVIFTTDEFEEYIISQLIEEGTVIDSADCEIANTIRGLKHAITTEKYMDDEWAGILDMYVQHSKGLVTSADVEKYEDVLSNPEYTVWNYTTELCDYPNPAVNIPSIPVTARDVFWFNYEKGITGELYWCVNTHVNCTKVNGLRYAPIYEPYTNASHEGVSNGGGYYLYPGVHYGSETPFPSMRLAVKRDGIDDYTYMTELENRYSGQGVKQLITFMNELIIQNGRSMVNEKALYSARENLAKLIVMFDKHGLEIKEIKYNGNQIDCKIVANADTTVKVNSSSSTAVVSGTTKSYTFSVQLTDGFNLSCKTGDREDNVSFGVKKPSTLVNGFESESDMQAISVQTKYNSSTAQASLIKRSGSKSAKVILSGYTDFTNPVTILSFKPGFYFELNSLGLTNGLQGVSEITFYVYNAGATRNYEIYAQLMENDNSRTVIYDSINLKGYSWNKVSVTNMNMISLNKSDYKNVYRIGLRTANMYEGNNTYKTTLYVDDVMIGRA